ncbi:cyclic nucleotide-binding domain-containing protein [Candidatus Gracilibacteria bacterium]|nr:cyclic nucleotide-binding domain-containing protein [Candidatus Gracilibacteria bacterium]
MTSIDPTQDSTQTNCNDIDTKPVDIDLNSPQKYRKTIEKLIQESYVFRNFSPDVIIGNMNKGNISVSKYPNGSFIILEESLNCDLFFVLMKGKLGIYKGDKQINTVSRVSAIGEIGFINPDFGRTATVKAEEDSYVMLFSKGFVNDLPNEYKEQFYKNLCTDMAYKIMMINDKIHKWSGEKGKDECIKTQNEIKELIGNI